MKHTPRRPSNSWDDNTPENRGGGKPEREKSGKSTGRKVLGTVGTLLASLFMLCIITGCIVVCVLTVYILQYMGTDTDVSLDDVEASYTTIMYAQDTASGEYYELQRIHGQENRIWADYDQFPDSLINAAIAAEDERFLSHQGVDWQRTIMAGLNMFLPIYPSLQGGSTITQQTIKNITGDDAVRVDRKVREIFRALNLEQTATKEQILEAYLNTLALANNTNGVQAAANLYFDKDVSELTIAESAAIMAITKYPEHYNPFINPDNNKARRDWIIENMYDLGMISEQERDEAQNNELVFASGEVASGKLNSDYSWFVDHVIEEVLADLVEEYNYTYSYATELFFQGGYRIYTTVDEDMQNYLQAKYEDEATFPEIKNEVYPQSAFVITDLNGKILAMVGEKGEKTQDRDFNRATMALRQPGSTIKPIASYPVAFENQLITWSTVFNDRPMTYRDEEESTMYDWPINHYGSYLSYPVTVDEAIRRSTNTIPAQLVDMLGPQMIFDFMTQKLMMDSLVESRGEGGLVYTDITLASMSLGALTDGVTPLDMAGAYQYIGNGGLRTEPYAYTHVLDSQGNVVLERSITPQRVTSYETATIMNRLLQRVTTATYGTGTNAKFRQDIPVAGKTGTTDHDVDQWFVGITPYYIGVCWLGYDEAETIGYYQYPPPLIWNNIMSGLHEDLPAADFSYSNKVVSKTYCTQTGLVAGPECENTLVGWYDIENVPDECTYCTGEDEIDDLGLFFETDPYLGEDDGIIDVDLSDITDDSDDIGSTR